MSLTLRIRSKPQTALSVKTSGYRIRPGSFAASFALHSGIVAILALHPMQDQTVNTTLYREIIRPQEHKIIFYDFRKKLPEVRAAKKIGDSPRPRGLQLSDQTMIAASPDAKSNQQFVWQPLPKIELPRDLPLPNLIARASTALPPPPPAEVKRPLERPATQGVPSPKQNPSPVNAKGDIDHVSEPATVPAPKPATRKIFVPPSPKLEARAATPVSPLDAPPLDARNKASVTPDVLAVLRLKKTFVLPPPEPQPTRSAGATTMLETPAAALSRAGSGGVTSALPAGLGTPTLSAGIAPPPNAPLGTAASTGNANADLAITGLHATGELKGPLPDGARPGRFSKAPELGVPSSGEGDASGALTVPGLTIRADRTNPIPHPPVNPGRRAILYAETLRTVLAATLSVPLRPSSRTIPSNIDARFLGRSVYTMVVPIENLPDYGGDWILWFAEREQKPGDAPSMHAPVPFRKLEPVNLMLAGNRVARRLQIAAVIKQDGRVDRISLLRRAAPAVEQAVIQDLESWEFKPATRGGTPVDVDVVIEIPFNLTAELASTGSN
jgi:hypothetical protein